MDHQGRFQVHGEGNTLLDSQPWDEDKPLEALKAHHYLSGLKYRIHRKEREILEDAFNKTHSHIDRVASNGGHGPYKFSWPKPSRRDKRRVDTEIQRGIAFV